MNTAHKTLMGMAAAVAVLGLSTGCTTVQKGAAAGGAIGAVTGGVLGHNHGSLNTGWGALAGAGTGAAVGGLAGDAYAELNKDDERRDYDNLRAQLLDAERELAELRAGGMNADDMARLEQLERDLADAREQLAAARSSLSGNERDLADARAEANRAGSEATRLRADLEKERTRNNELGNELASVQTERDASQAKAEELERRLRDAERSLAEARSELDVISVSLREKEEAFNKLRAELADLNVELEQTNRGLTMTIMNQLLYTPGSADLSPSGRELISKVADIIQTNFPDRELVIEGHTDNVPITHSGWSSNWELGAGRALTVLHELVNAHGFSPARLSATSFGEHRPAASNATDTGRASNRRSVIVILPESMPLRRNEFAGL